MLLRTIFFYAVIFFFGISATLFAGQSQPVTAPEAGFRAEYLAQLDDVGEKLVQLAEAVPSEKYNWRPAEGIRSVSEVYVHVAAGNFLVTKIVGVPSSVEPTPQMEKQITEKLQVIDMLKKSLEHVRHTILSLSDDDLNKTAELFGEKTTVRAALFQLANHMHEHLGQSIAYARSISVVPPWSIKDQGTVE